MTVPLDKAIPIDPFEKVGYYVTEYLKTATAPDSITKSHCEVNSHGVFALLKGSDDHKFMFGDLPTAAENKDRSLKVLGAALNLSNDFVEELTKRSATFEEARDEMVKEAARNRGFLDLSGEADGEGNGREKACTVEELLQLDLPPRKALIEGMLHVGETIAIVGRQKVGKSRLVQQMALCLANGEPFLGMKIPSPVRTLMIDLENGKQSLSTRFKAMGGQRSGDGLIHVWCAESLASPLPDVSSEGSARLRELITAIQPDVVIIDPWRLWLAGGDENDAREVVRGLKVLASLRQIRKDLAIIVIHHLRKEKYENPKRLLEDPALWVDAVSGHHSLMGHTDSIFGLERQHDEDGNQLIIFGGIARSLEPPTLILEEDDTLRFNVSANGSAAKQVMTPAEQRIWECALALRRFTFTKLLEQAATRNKKAVSKTLRIAETHGLVTRQGKLYIVSDPAPSTVE